MTVHRSITAVLVTAWVLAGSPRAVADEPPIQLNLRAGRPLRVALDEKIRVKRVGQQVTATVIEPLYAHDRIVVPAGSKAIGHIEQLQSASKKTRARAILGGDFTPPRHVGLQFDTLVLSDGRSMPIRTFVTVGIESVTLKVAGASRRAGVAARAREKIAREAKQTIAVVRRPGKLERLKDMFIRSLPYHPQYLPRGTVYSARLLDPLDFGSATPAERAAAGTPPAPESILNARLVTSLNSATTVPGTQIEAVLTQPVFSADQRLILPEGATLRGAVTFTKRARHFHRHGQLRFVFENVQSLDRDTEKLLASLYSVESRQDDRVVIDEEGGATGSSPKARLVAPALAGLALAGSLHGKLDTDVDLDAVGPEMEYGGVGSSSLGGFLGWGSVGVGLSQIARPVTIGIAVVGLGRAAYSNVFGKGREVSFPADTPIQVQLAPGAGSTKP